MNCGAEIKYWYARCRNPGTFFEALWHWQVASAVTVSEITMIKEKDGLMFLIDCLGEKSGVKNRCGAS